MHKFICNLDNYFSMITSQVCYFIHIFYNDKNQLQYRSKSHSVNMRRLGSKYLYQVYNWLQKLHIIILCCVCCTLLYEPLPQTKKLTTQDSNSVMFLAATRERRIFILKITQKIKQTGFTDVHPILTNHSDERYPVVRYQTWGCLVP